MARSRRVTRAWWPPPCQAKLDEEEKRARRQSKNDERRNQRQVAVPLLGERLAPAPAELECETELMNDQSAQGDQGKARTRAGADTTLNRVLCLATTAL